MCIVFNIILFGTFTWKVNADLSLCLIEEIQSCLLNSGDVGCGMFQCFSNSSCEIQGLHHICLTLLHNAGHYNLQVRISLYVSHSFTLKINALSQLCRYACGALTDRLRGSSEVAWAGLEKAYLDTCFYFI